MTLSVMKSKVSDVNVLGASSTQCSAILFQQDGTLIILINDVVMNLVALRCHEVLGLDHQGHPIINAGDFSFGAAFSVDMLFPGHGVNRTLTK